MKKESKKERKKSKEKSEKRSIGRYVNRLWARQLTKPGIKLTPFLQLSNNHLILKHNPN